LNSEPPADFEPDPIEATRANGAGDDVLDALEAEDEEADEDELESPDGRTLDPDEAEAMAEEFADAAFEETAAASDDGKVGA